MTLTAPSPPGDAGWVALSTVTARRDLGLRLETPVQGPPAWVRWAGVVELADPAPHLRGGELLLTSGAGLDLSPDPVQAYVASLVGAGVGAVGFGAEPGNAPLPDVLVRECRRQFLPLVRVPAETPFVAVCQAVQDLLRARRQEELRWLETTHHNLARAAYEPDPRAAMVNVLTHSLGCWAVLVDESGQVCESSGPVPSPLPRALADLAAAARRAVAPEWVRANVDGEELLVRRIGAGDVLCAGVSGGLDAAGRAVLGAAVVPLESVGGPRVGGTRAARLTSALSRLVLADPVAVGRARRDAVTSLVPSVFARWRVVCGAAVGDEAAAGPAEVREIVASPVVEVADGRMRGVVPDRGGEDGAPGWGVLEELRSRGWLAVLSRPVAADELHEADTEARGLLERARAVGSPLTWQGADTSWEAMVNQSQARRLSSAMLAPITGGDTTSRDLRHALRVWLAHHGDLDRTAATLGTNRRTVRERVEGVQRRLGVDLADPEQRMRLWFALRWATDPR
ncbi:PucR family transcriptional regulator [Spiractinospora alimapuensis]|uniref:PucR family transcriptional regulator n=1 Tax=Spiractinospora alimapuensis TaxID=2820884 RepID=UPI001F29468B|nr:PucR family transcriptional regulator [Spiractinospora alimapuensis]QVQ52559.1 PucR family transcriptional regulator [Spiractinospora alimapuensis]